MAGDYARFAPCATVQIHHQSPLLLHILLSFPRCQMKHMIRQ
jgi:hypothetical protein